VQGRVLSLIDDAHTAAAQPLDDPVVRDGLTDHWRESYVGDPGKSMKAVELAAARHALVAVESPVTTKSRQRVEVCSNKIWHYGVISNTITQSQLALQRHYCRAARRRRLLYR
jgi:hypothetical protein